MLGILLGLFTGGVVGYRIGSSGSATVSADASRWSGRVGQLPFRVYRNGPSWAWGVGLPERGQGAEPTAVDALRQAIAWAIESGGASPADSARVEFNRADLVVSVVVAPDSNQPAVWRWTLSAPSGSERGTNVSRGRATLDMLLALQPYTVPS